MGYIAMALKIDKKKTAQDSRLNVRLAPDLKARIRRAATVLGQDLTEFAVSTLNDRAIEVLEEHETLILSDAERRAFLDILAGDAPAPTKKALAAAKRYKSGTKKGAIYEFTD
ncbi:hypothetical protein BH24ACI3_BH24ACI3_11990 [soil metagenome]